MADDMAGRAAAPPDVILAMQAVRVVPVVTVDHAAYGPLVTQALLDGGLPVVEITLRTSAGLGALRAAAAVPGALVGAGTVLTAEAANMAIDAGARFVVSPGIVEPVVKACRRRDMLVLPGIATPTELLRALELGCATVKVFPASTLGGPALLRALSALGTGASFVPTGGITVESAPAYLAIPEVVAVGGSWMVPADRVAAGDWDAVRSRATACRPLRAAAA